MAMTKTKQQSGAKDRILEAADRLFYEQGYHKTGVNQLIDEAQVAKASFYSHFSSKRKLLKAYLKQRHTHWFEDLHEVVNAYNDPEQKIVGLFEYREKWIKETDYRGCAFININTELPDDDGEITSIVQGHKQDARTNGQANREPRQFGGRQGGCWPGGPQR